MVNRELAKSYMVRAKIRLKILEEFLKVEDYADVIRESQEIIELIEKAVLLHVGISPPKWHDVSDIILENRAKFPSHFYSEFEKLVRNAKWLRSQRELSFYGDMDFIPEKSYTRDDALRAIKTANKLYEIAKEFIKEEF